LKSLVKESVSLRYVSWAILAASCRLAVTIYCK